MALIDSSPVRGRPFFGANKPPRLLNTVAGFGVTPRVGLRLGVAVAHGAYASVDEVVEIARAAIATRRWCRSKASGRSDYTRIVGEVVRSVMETARADARARGGWVEVDADPDARAVRRRARRLATLRRISGRYRATSSGSDYERFEAVAGFRITPDLTLRAGYLGRKGYVVFHWDDQVIGVDRVAEEDLVIW